MKDESIVYLDRVSKVYLSSGIEVYAVRNVTIDIKSGEFYSLLGSSGSGKTTTLRVIGGFEIPEYGQVFINGEEVTTQPPYQRNVHTVFQSYALFPHLSVAENIAYPLTIAKTPRSDIQSRVDESLRMFRIEGLGDRRPSQLSGGQQQRVALARALINRPKVLLLDEPLSALDAKVREEVRQELRELQRQTQITFIYVTHDQEEALALSDRIAVMHNGRVEQIGTPDQIYDRPQSLFVAQFIGKANLLTGEVQNVEASTALINIQGTVIKAAVHHPVAAGATATLMIRPERIQMNSSTPAENQIKGRSIGATYTGQLLEIVAETAIGRLTVTQLSRQNLATGEITLSWNSQDCLMIPSDQG